MLSKNATRRRIVRAFFRREYATAGAFHTADGVLYSYSWPLAKLDDSGKAVALPKLNEHYSRTTSEHQAITRLAIDCSRYF